MLSGLLTIVMPSGPLTIVFSTLSCLRIWMYASQEPSDLFVYIATSCFINFLPFRRADETSLTVVCVPENGQLCVLFCESD